MKILTSLLPCTRPTMQTAQAAHHEGDHKMMKAEGTRAVVAVMKEIVAIDPETKGDLGYSGPAHHR